ncbi:MAG: hypothetical protein NDJ89_14145 [Oligoflexia bacterium]|nr:hypothetical protein [Oligoflexia bacterium]
MDRIFRYESYKQYLRDWVAEKRGTTSELAQGAGCHRTYLSQVLNAKAELTADHAVNLCDFFQFDPLEADYFLTCHLCERARLKSAKALLHDRLTKIRQRADRISKRIQPKDRARLEEPSSLGAYYADNHASLIHLATSCLSTQTAQSISRKFGIPVGKVQNVLEYLATMGLVFRSGEKYSHSGKSIHLDRQNPFTRMNHLNWRLQAVEDSYNQESIHYTNVFTVGVEDASALRERLLQFIGSQSKQIAESGSEALMVFCCDLFSPGSPSSLSDSAKRESN